MTTQLIALLADRHALLAEIRRRVAKYSEDQPRVPAGSPDGGQWTDGGGGYGGSGAARLDSPSQLSPSRKYSPRQAVESYAGIHYESINNYWRGSYKPPTGEGEVFVMEVTAVVDHEIAMNKLSETTTLYRGISHGNLAANAEKLVGRTIDSPAFVSTSIDRNIAEQFARGQSGSLFVITAPAGTSALSMNSIREFESKEKEYLLPRNQKFRVDRVERQNGRPIIHATVIQ